MTRKELLAELIAKVEAGIEDTPDFSALVSRPIMQCKADEAYRGSLDAAKALHQAVVPEQSIRIERRVGGWVVWLDSPHQGISDNPARAWLLAILYALHNMEPDA